MSSKTIIVGITGASGSPYAVETLNCLLSLGMKVYVVSSPVGKQVWQHENGFPFKEYLDELNEKYPDQLTLENNNDLGGKPASGSFRHDGMIITPCSMKCMAAIANGFASNLIERSADVCLKERFPLVLVTRETPLNLIHIENMAKVTRAGGIVMPASPGFYHKDTSVEGMVKFVVGKSLDMLGITDHNLFKRWKEDGEEC
ncbi:MAG: UbiX family flavin prenyltransferase [Lentisphaeraceae bacterium]|nr:UbiX family flavin prenyltransferase [Lentisphaeraceae bacterium]